jgi:hypothetical protein
MHLLKQRSLVFYVGFVLILTMAIGGVAFGVFADGGGNATATLSTGTLTETDTFNPSFPSTQLTGKDLLLTVPGGLSMQVTDATGSGSGWNTTISGTAFTCQIGPCQGNVGNGGGVHGQTTLDSTDQNNGTGPLYLTKITAQCAAGNGCTAPSPASTVSTKLFMTTTSQKIYSDDVNSGMGIVDVTADLTLKVPGNTFSGTYQSTVTLGVVSGP